MQFNKYFLKYNYLFNFRAADMLLAGAIMKTSFQPHEAHVPFVLQMFMDYNLYGMNFLHSKSCWFRKLVGNYFEKLLILIFTYFQFQNKNF